MEETAATPDAGDTEGVAGEIVEIDSLSSEGDGVGRLADGGFSDALVMMKTLEDHAEEGEEVFESGEAYLAAARAHRDELTVRVLEAIHHANAGAGPAGDRVAIALAAIRSIYEHDDLGDEALFTQVEAVLRAYDIAN